MLESKNILSAIGLGIKSIFELFMSPNGIPGTTGTNTKTILNTIIVHISGCLSVCLARSFVSCQFACVLALTVAHGNSGHQQERVPATVQTKDFINPLCIFSGHFMSWRPYIFCLIYAKSNLVSSAPFILLPSFCFYNRNKFLFILTWRNRPKRLSREIAPKTPLHLFPSKFLFKYLRNFM